MEQYTSWNLVLLELNRLNEDLNNRHPSQGIDYLIFCERLHLAVNSLRNLRDIISGENIELLLQSFQLYTLIIEREVNDTSIRPAIIMLETHSEGSSRRGRPKLSIAEDALLYFRELSYSWKDISLMLNVSQWTVYRRVRELHLENVTGFSNISDDDLDQHIQHFKQVHGPIAGRSLALGYLRSLGLPVQQERVAKALVRVKPTNSGLRWTSLIKRKKYNVPGPNNLWHIDGHPSLVNWDL